MHRFPLLAGCLVLLASSATLAQTPAGSAEKGKQLTYTCQGCHGVTGYKNAYPSYSVPKLGGQSVTYLQNALKAYASGERSHPTMYSHASSLTEQERADIAAYFASKPAPTSTVVGTPPPATQICASCHGADGAKPVAPENPILAGQYRDYLLRALQDYKSGKRKNPIMSGIIMTVDAKEFPAIAQFYSRQKSLCSTDEVMKQGQCAQR
ncbi:MAG: cytochrome c4 [Gammaproteobacteria bacterium]|nr:cytochrome c4 [Gammaproteobacteria bacterium]